MYIEIAVEVFDNPDDWNDLMRIIGMVQDDRHQWYVGSNVGAILQSSFFKRDGHLERQTKELLKKSLTHLGKHKDERKKIVICSQPQPSAINHFKPRRAIEFLSEPLVLVVEDHESDGGFVEILCQRFNKKKLSEAIKQRFLKIEHGGGRPGVLKAIKRHVERMNNTVAYRLVAMVDGDKLAPSDQESAPYDLKELCGQHQIDLWVSSKREIENYIPQASIISWYNSASQQRQHLVRECLEVFEELKDEQKDYYDMKCGLPSEPKQNKPNHFAHQSLFKNLSNSEKRKLSSGFGRDVWKAVKHPASARAFRQRSNADLRKGETELELLLKMIELRL